MVIRTNMTDEDLVAKYAAEAQHSIDEEAKKESLKHQTRFLMQNLGKNHYLI